MRGWSWASKRRLRLLGHAVAVHEEDGVARLGRPRGGGHGVGGVLGRDDEDAIAALAAGRRLEGVERPRQREGVAAGDVGRAQAGRARDVADAHDLRAARCLGAERAQGGQRVARGVRQLGTVGEQDRGAHRRRGEDRSGDAGAPVAGVDERDGGGAVLGHRGGEDGPRHAGRVGDRVGAADARRVLRREGREAEVVDGLGLRALDAQAGRLVGAVAVFVRSARPHAVAASAASRQARTAAGRRIRRRTVRKAGDDCAGRPRPPVRVEDIA